MAELTNYAEIWPHRYKVSDVQQATEMDVLSPGYAASSYVWVFCSPEPPNPHFFYCKPGISRSCLFSVM